MSKLPSLSMQSPFCFINSYLLNFIIIIKVSRKRKILYFSLNFGKQSTIGFSIKLLNFCYSDKKSCIATRFCKICNLSKHWLKSYEFYVWGGGAKTLFDKKITRKNGNNDGNLDIIITKIVFESKNNS